MNEQVKKPLWLESINQTIDQIHYHKEVMTTLDNAGLLPECTYYYYSGICLGKVDNYQGFLDVLKRIKRTGLKVKISGYTNVGSYHMEVSLAVSQAEGDYFSIELRIQVGELEESLKRISKGKCHIKTETIKPIEFKPYDSTCIVCES